MKNKGYTFDDRIAAPATARTVSAVGVIRTSGVGSVDALAPFFSRGKALLAAEGHTLHHGILQRPQTEGGVSLVDEVVLGVYRAPKSYTGEEGVEIFCHGSPAVMDAVMALLDEAGFRRAEPGEFTLRAFMAGKMDLTRAEAVHELVTAQTDQARQLAMGRLSGSVAHQLEALKKGLMDISAALALHLDYPEDEADPPEVGELPLAELISQAEGLLATYGMGRLYQEGALVALAGATNAGKSSLFNLILKEERSIVSERHGTTRDFLEAQVSLEGIPLRLVDTAGLRNLADDDDPIEREGIRRSGEILKRADVILFLVDGCRGESPEDARRLADWHQDEEAPPVIPLWNKVDAPEAQPLPAEYIGISAHTGEGFSRLHTKLSQLLTKNTGPLPGAVIESQRQKEGLEELREALRLVQRGLDEGQPLDMVSVDLEEARDALGRLTGEITSEDVLHHMFSHFCVGK